MAAGLWAESRQQRRGWWHGMLRRQAGAASKRPVTFLVRADCLLLPPSRFPDALGLFIITMHSTTVCCDGHPLCCAVQAMLLSDCRWWPGASVGSWGGRRLMRTRFYSAAQGTIKSTHATISSSSNLTSKVKTFRTQTRNLFCPLIHMRSVCRALTGG